MTADSIFEFFLKLLAFGGGAAGVAYLMFQYLGKTWIENKFAQRLELLRHQQAMELQRLHVEIDAKVSGVIRLQERDFDVLPEAWARLYKAHALVSWLVSPLQTYLDVDRMTQAQLEETLSATTFTDTQKEEVRNARHRSKTYQDILFWHRLHRVKKGFGKLQSYIARNGIFLPKDLKQDFEVISQKLWSAVVSKEVGHEAKDWKMQTEGWTSIKDEIEPLYRTIEAQIQERLQAHGKG